MRAQDNSLTIALKERELYEAISTAGGPNMPVVFNIHPFTEEWNQDTLQWLVRKTFFKTPEVLR